MGAAGHSVTSHRSSDMWAAKGWGGKGTEEGAMELRLQSTSALSSRVIYEKM